MEKGYWLIKIGVLLLVIVAALLVAVFIPITSAYHYVYQGDNVSLGDTVDLTGVYGWTGLLGWWERDYYEGGTTEPDVIIDLNEYLKVEVVYLDPAVWKVGRWYQWDKKGEEIHGNTFVFRVNPQTNFTKTNKTSTIIKVNVSNTPEPIASTPIQPTPITPEPITIVVTPIPTPTFPPPRGLSIPPYIVAVVVIGGSLLFLWFRER
jgi:hypothetical protein